MMSAGCLSDASVLGAPNTRRVLRSTEPTAAAVGSSQHIRRTADDFRAEGRKTFLHIGQCQRLNHGDQLSVGCGDRFSTFDDTIDRDEPHVIATIDMEIGDVATLK